MKQKLVPDPAPPIILRQQPPRPKTPEPLIIREKPPRPPQKIDKKIINIPGKKIPPPPRKILVENLPDLPSKPKSIIIERWLPYSQTKRKVIRWRSSPPERSYQRRATGSNPLRFSFRSGRVKSAGHGLFRHHHHRQDHP